MTSEFSHGSRYGQAGVTFCDAGIKWLDPREEVALPFVEPQLSRQTSCGERANQRTETNGIFFVFGAADKYHFTGHRVAGSELALENQCSHLATTRANW